ncbi:MAG: C4-type zinc ribbon domain-containing protein [Candidatus Hydrogenedentota bacterium]
MKTLLRLQDLDLRIEACKAREIEIPKQKEKFKVQKQRLEDELEERREALKKLQVEQRECESDIEQKQAQTNKYNEQLFSIKKNEEYQALLHEIDLLKKQIAIQEERIISLMVELDDAKARFEEDQKRIKTEIETLDNQCREVDAELAEAIEARKNLDEKRKPLLQEVEPQLLSKYRRIRQSKASGPAVVPLRGDICSGCNMNVRPQIINEILAGEIRACPQCGRLLYDKETISQEEQNAESSV